MLFLVLLQIVSAQNSTITNIVVSALESAVLVPIYYLVAAGGAVFVLLLIIACCYCRRGARIVHAQQLPAAGPVVIGRLRGS